MEDTLSNQIEELFSLEMNDEQIASVISVDPNLNLQVSARTVRRRRNALGLSLSNLLPSTAVDTLVRNVVSEIGFEPGRRYVGGYLRSMGYRVGDKRIQCSLQRNYPHHHAQRLYGVSRRTNPLRYSADYFGDKMHMDQNEKAVMYGLTYVAAIDGFSGLILDCVTMSVKNPILIYDILFRPIIETHGIWNTVVTDMGRKFALSLSVQTALTEFRRKAHIHPVRQVKSTSNNRIERFWVEHNSRVTYPIKRVLVEMEEQGRLDLSDPLHRHSCSTIAMQIANVGLQRHIRARNHRHVRGRGIPMVLKGDSTAAPIRSDIIPSIEVAVQQYRAAGGHLTEPATFGADPLAERPDLMAARLDMLARYDPAVVYSSCLSGGNSDLSDYIQYYNTTTTALSQYIVH